MTLFRARADEGWQKVLVVGEGDELVEVLVPLDPGRAGSLPADVAPGSRAPRQAAASSGVRDALDAAGPGGRVLAIDYAATTAELCSRPWTEWVRTYRQHQRGGHPLNELGSHDITCEVAVDQLPPPTSQRSQADWLGSLGIDELVEEGRRIWRERADIGYLAALRARSRVNAAAALLDGAGLGAFQVLEWHPSIGRAHV